MKIKIYRVLGWILIISGMLGSLTPFFGPHKFQALVSSPGKEMFPAVYGTLMALALNIFIWTGIILQWRADRNEDPEIRSKWGKCIKPYLSFTILMLIVTAVLLFVTHSSGRA